MKNTIKIFKSRVGGLKTKPKPNPSSCHPERSIFAKKLCRPCYEKQLRMSNPEYAARQRINNKQWVAGNKQRIRKGQNLWLAKQDPDYRWSVNLRYEYGLTAKQYYDMLFLQGGVCGICKKAPDKKRLAIDHDHKTGEIRGLLCFRCNFGLSWFQENSEILANASKHVNKVLCFGGPDGTEIRFEYLTKQGKQKHG